jgi:hypothetical protein
MLCFPFNLRPLFKTSLTYTATMLRRFTEKLLCTVNFSGAAGAETLATEHGPSARRLEWHAVAFAALIASDFVTLAVTTTASAARAGTEVCAARIAARLAAFRLAQVAFVVILLFPLCKRERLTTFGTGDLKVWHEFFSRKAKRGSLASIF